jgi:hypothetical protein
MCASQPSRAKYPLATISAYGPDNRRATKVAVGILRRPRCVLFTAVVELGFFRGRCERLRGISSTTFRCGGAIRSLPASLATSLSVLRSADDTRCRGNRGGDVLHVSARWYGNCGVIRILVGSRSGGCRSRRTGCARGNDANPVTDNRMEHVDSDLRVTAPHPGHDVPRVLVPGNRSAAPGAQDAKNALIGHK